MKTTANLDTIEYIDLYNEKLNHSFAYGCIEKKKWSWRKFKYEIIKSEPGFYTNDGIWTFYGGFPELYTEAQLITKGHLVYGEQVYHKSYVYIHFTSGDSKKVKFNNYNEATNYYINLNKRLALKAEL